MTLWVNGALVDPDAPVLRADDHGITVGDGVFETMKVVDGQPFAMTSPPAPARGVGGRSGPRCRLRRVQRRRRDGLAPTGRRRGPGCASRSPAGRRRSAPPEATRPRPSSSRPRRCRAGPTADVAIVPWTRNERAATAGLKTTSYADNVVALRHAHEHGAAEAIFANTVGELCEGTGSNVFVGIGGELVTPPLSSGCLAGITRELIIEWLGDVAERPLPIAALAEADEAFLASSTRDVQPIRAVDGIALPAAPGPLTQTGDRGVRAAKCGGGPVTVVVSPEPLTPAEVVAVARGAAGRRCPIRRSRRWRRRARTSRRWPPRRPAGVRDLDRVRRAGDDAHPGGPPRRPAAFPRPLARRRQRYAGRARGGSRDAAAAAAHTRDRADRGAALTPQAMAALLNAGHHSGRCRSTARSGAAGTSHRLPPARWR